jgi:hypothetical protein
LASWWAQNVVKPGRRVSSAFDPLFNKETRMKAPKVKLSRFALATTVSFLVAGSGTGAIT